MKNKLFLLLLIVIGLFSINVNALDNPSWPINYSFGDNNEFTCNIEGFEVRIYPIDLDKKTTTTVNYDDGSTSTTTTMDDLLLYINNQYNRKEELNANNYEIHPEYKTDKLYGSDGLFVKLNLNMTKDKLEQIVAPELAAATEKKMYLIETVVKYKLTNYPQDYKYFSNDNFMKSLYNLFINNKTNPATTEIGDSIYQVVGFSTITKEPNKDAELNYNDTLSDENELASYIFNNLSLYKEKPLDEDIPNKIIMFHDVNNIQFLIDNVNAIEKYLEEETKLELDYKEYKSQNVKVGNTASSVPSLYYFIAFALIIIGISIITHVVTKYKEYQN